VSCAYLELSKLYLLPGEYPTWRRVGTSPLMLMEGEPCIGERETRVEK